MKVARLAVLGIALAAGGGAAFFVSGKAPPPAQIIQNAPAMETDEVLVAAKDVPLGTLVAETDIRWQLWPKASTSAGMMLKSVTAGAIEEAKGSVTRGSFVEGEPIRRDKLVKGSNSGFMSAILPTGLRAMAIKIESTGETSAGGFILPNDHVDVVRSFRDDAASRVAGTDTYGAQIILTNIRVLAIGQNVQEKNGERVVVGTNATLELDPNQVEILTLAQRVGQLSLALRSMVDSHQPSQLNLSPQEGGGLTVIRYGVSAQVGR